MNCNRCDKDIKHPSKIHYELQEYEMEKGEYDELGSHKLCEKCFVEFQLFMSECD